MKTRIKSRRKAEFGDFQTPLPLARACCDVVARLCPAPATVLEPTCGEGSFLLAAAERFPSLVSGIGIEINERYARTASQRLATHGGRFVVWNADLFSLDLKAALSGLTEPILVVGNPPWVTNAELGRLQSANLPAKSNFQNHRGLAALTGKSNFDISEWMMIQVLQALDGRDAAVGMLCKTSVARRVLAFVWQQVLRVTSAAQFQIDAASSFNAAVDACLLVCRLQEGPVSSTCSVYSDLSASAAEHVVGWRDRQLVAEVDAYERRRALRAVTGPRWRSGIKHDCSRVMEFTRQGTLFVNGLNEAVSLEEECLYPLLKSSDLTRSDATPPRKWVLVTQRSVGEDTCRLRRTAPHTWEYLCSHRDRLDRRASSIYNGRPPFSIFGVGDYSFAPWKVAVSGLYKRLAFRKVGPWNGRPAMLDDTAYFLPCTNEQLADLLLALLRSQPAQEFLQSLIFWDSKRPITVEVLRQIDLAALAQELGLSREQQARIAGLLETGSEDAVSERQRSLFA